MKFAVIVLAAAACATPASLPNRSLSATTETGHAARVSLSTGVRVCLDPSGDNDVRVVEPSGVAPFDRAVVHDAEGWSYGPDAPTCKHVTVRYQP
jgi:hypothetical protein